MLVNSMRPRLRSPEVMATPVARSYKLETMEQELLELMLQHPDSVPSVLEAIHADQLSTEIAKLIFGKFEQLHNEDVIPTFDRLLLSFDEPEVKTLLGDFGRRGRKQERSRAADSDQRPAESIRTTPS